MNKTINAHLNAGASRAVFETIYPFLIDLGRLYVHRYSVSHGILTSSTRGLELVIDPNWSPDQAMSEVLNEYLISRLPKSGNNSRGTRTRT